MFRPNRMSMDGLSSLFGFVIVVRLLLNEIMVNFLSLRF